jgi:hypothetical protein
MIYIQPDGLKHLRPAERAVFMRYIRPEVLGCKQQRGLLLQEIFSQMASDVSTRENCRDDYFYERYLARLPQMQATERPIVMRYIRSDSLRQKHQRGLLL